MATWCEGFAFFLISCFTLRVAGNRVVTHSAGGELRVFATTFNAQNRRYDNSPAMHDLTEVMLRGHEDPGEEADIVFLGLQEFKDDKAGLGNMAGEGKLWREFAKTTMDTLTNDLEQAATPPPEVREAKAALEKHWHDQHLEIQAELAKFQSNYGETANDFHLHIANLSVVNVLSKKAKDVTMEVSKEIEQRLKRFDAESAAPKDARVARFADMSDAVSNLKAWWDKLSELPKSATQDALFAQIHAWTEGSLNQIEELKRVYPNLLLSDNGARLSRAYEEAIDTSKKLEREFLKKTKMKGEAFQMALIAFHNGVQNAVKRREDDISSQLKNDWEKIGDDIKTLTLHLDNFAQDGSISQSVAEVARQAAKEHSDQLVRELDTWKQQSHDLLGQLLKRKKYSVKSEHVQVKMEPQKFDSGWKCEMSPGGAHYDTMMYAYVNPFSKWQIKAEEFHSEKCVKRASPSQENLGCNINNIDGMECGKVVNLMVFRAEKGDTSLRLCGLNTHMSFAGEAAQRMQYIADAMEQTNEAKCDAVFFMGDFNSRLHCEAEQKQELPPFERKGSSESSFDYILDTFCTGDVCELRDSNLDEVNQILNRDELECYELRSKKEAGAKWGAGKKVKYWDVITTPNKVKSFGIQEAGVVGFAPTYKLKGADKIKQETPKRCLKDEPTCFINDSGKGKHNPAWTDRILMQSSSNVHFTTNEYSRRPISGEFGSDHVPVTARVTMRLADGV